MNWLQQNGLGWNGVQWIGPKLPKIFFIKSQKQWTKSNNKTGEDIDEMNWLMKEIKKSLHWRENNQMAWDSMKCG